MALLRVRLPGRERARLGRALRALAWGCCLAAAAGLGLAAHLECALGRRAALLGDAGARRLPRLGLAAGGLWALVGLAGARLSGDALRPGRLPRWKPLAGPYLALSFLLASLTLAAAPLGYLMRGGLDASLRAGLRDGLRFYKDTDTPGRCFHKRAVDLLQMEFQCCGVDGFRDWFAVQWVSNRYLDFNDGDVRDRIKSNVDGRYLINSVPFSCCNPSSPRPCIQHQITNNSAHFNYEVESEELNIWMRGCREAVLNYYTGTMATLSTAVLLFSIVQLGMLTGLRYLSVSALAALEQPEPESDAEGYLLEKGPLETVRAAAKALTSMFSSNRVQTDPAPAEEKAADK